METQQDGTVIGTASGKFLKYSHLAEIDALILNGEVGRDVIIGPFCLFENRVKIGDNTIIRPYVFLKEGTQVGSGCYLGSYFRSGGGDIIGDGVTIRTKATSSPGVKIGDNSFIGPHALILHGQVDGAHEPAQIGRNCYIGSGAIINPGVVLCDDVIIGAGAVVTRSIDKPGVYVGIPARVLTYHV